MTEVATLELIVKLKDQTTRQLNSINEKFKSTGSKVTALAKKFTLLAGVAGIAAVGVALKGSISAFTEFEDAMAGVKKTTGMSDEAIASLGEGIKTMAGKIPLAHTELADIAAVAGQLGIQGKDAILAFTKTAAEMATAFDMPAEKAATVAAKLTNIYGLGIEKASNLASAINVLGNTTAASESQISNYAMSLGASAKNMGFSSTEAVAMGASLISMGMDASDAGTRLNAAFVQMGTKVEELSLFLGVTQEEFGAAFGEDPMAMLMRITEKIGKIEDPLERARVSAELFGRVGGKAITGLGGNLEGLQTNLDNAAKGFEENTSLSEEFAAKTNTLKARMQLLRNALSGAAITLGTALAPYVEKLVLWFTSMVPVIMELGGELKTKLTPTFKKLGEFIKDIIPKVKELVKHFANELQPAFESIKNIVKILGKIFRTLASDLGGSETAFVSLTSVANTVAGVLNWVAGAIESVVNWFAKHPTITKFALAIAAAIVLITNPLLLVIAALAALAIVWDKDWGGIKTTTLKITAAISKEIEKFLGAVKTFWDDHGEKIIKAAQFIWDTIKTAFGIWVAAFQAAINVAMALIKGDWDGAWDAIKEYVSTVLGLITELWDTWGEDIKTVIADAFDKIVTKLTEWKTSAIQVFKDFVYALIGGSVLTDFATDTVALFSTLFTDIVAKIVEKAVDVVTEFTTMAVSWVAEITIGGANAVIEMATGIANMAAKTLEKAGTVVAEFTTMAVSWVAETVLGGANAVLAIATGIANMAAEVLADAGTVVAEFTTMATSFVAEITTGGIDAVTEMATGLVNVASKVTSKGLLIVAEFLTWCTDATSEITSGGVDFVTEMATGLTNVASKVTTGGVTIVTNFGTWCTNAGTKITEGAAAWLATISGWVDSIIGENGILTGWYNSVVALFGKLKDIKITWPDIPNPFARIKGWYDDAMSYISLIPGMGGDAGGVIGEDGEEPVTPTPPPQRVPVITYIDYDADDEEWSISGRDANGNLWDGTADKGYMDRVLRSIPDFYITPAALTKLSSELQDDAKASLQGIATAQGQEVSQFAKGGFVPYDMQADIHRGEFIVPAREVDEFMKGKKINIVNNYTFGNVYGVDELQKLLDRRDRELVRKLGALV